MALHSNPSVLPCDDHSVSFGLAHKAFVFRHSQCYTILYQTIRVSMQQATTILVSFISDQLELDLKRNVKVDEGELTQLEADEEAEEWEKVGIRLWMVMY